ncbi:MAG: hypothetical protein LBV74_16270 [Tannerella sp.]|jgi:hypothetical protein|nr:hypothetical protein [Tannerella sp.]
MNNNNLEILSCKNNYKLTSLDLSNNTNLKELTCIGNELQLTGELKNYNALEKLILVIYKAGTIEAKGSPLTVFDCKMGKFSLIDISGCDKLEDLKIERTAYYGDDGEESSILDLDGCLSLKSIDLNGFPFFLNSLDISSCTSLKKIRYYGDIDISKNTELEEVYVENIINDIKNNSKLKILHCGLIEDVETVDLSNQTQLEDLSCTIANTPIDISKCNTLKICSIKNYSEDVTYTNNMNVNGLPLLESFSAHISKSGNITFNIANCPALKKCRTNHAVALNISDCNSLEELICTESNTFNITRCPNLILLECSRSPISTLSIEPFTKLQTLYCENCLLKELDLRKNKELHSLQCYGNPDLQYIYVTHDIPHKSIGDARLVYSSPE